MKTRPGSSSSTKRRRSWRALEFLSYTSLLTVVTAHAPPAGQYPDVLWTRGGSLDNSAGDGESSVVETNLVDDEELDEYIEFLLAAAERKVTEHENPLYKRLFQHQPVTHDKEPWIDEDDSVKEKEEQATTKALLSVPISDEDEEDALLEKSSLLQASGEKDEAVLTAPDAIQREESSVVLEEVTESVAEDSSDTSTIPEEQVVLDPPDDKIHASLSLQKVTTSDDNVEEVASSDLIGATQSTEEVSMEEVEGDVIDEVLVEVAENEAPLESVHIATQVIKEEEEDVNITEVEMSEKPQLDDEILPEGQPALSPKMMEEQAGVADSIIEETMPSLLQEQMVPEVEIAKDAMSTDIEPTTLEESSTSNEISAVEFFLGPSAVDESPAVAEEVMASMKETTIAAQEAQESKEGGNHSMPSVQVEAESGSTHPSLMASLISKWRTYTSVLGHTARARDEVSSSDTITDVDLSLPEAVGEIVTCIEANTSSVNTTAGLVEDVEIAEKTSEAETDLIAQKTKQSRWGMMMANYMGLQKYISYSEDRIAVSRPNLYSSTTTARTDKGARTNHNITISWGRVTAAAIGIKSPSERTKKVRNPPRKHAQMWGRWTAAMMGIDLHQSSTRSYKRKPQRDYDLIYKKYYADYEYKSFVPEATSAPRQGEKAKAVREASLLNTTDSISTETLPSKSKSRVSSVWGKINSALNYERKSTFVKSLNETVDELNGIAAEASGFEISTGQAQLSPTIVRESIEADFSVSDEVQIDSQNVTQEEGPDCVAATTESFVDSTTPLQTLYEDLTTDHDIKSPETIADVEGNTDDDSLDESPSFVDAKSEQIDLPEAATEDTSNISQFDDVDTDLTDVESNIKETLFEQEIDPRDALPSSFASDIVASDTESSVDSEELHVYEDQDLEESFDPQDGQANPGLDPVALLETETLNFFYRFLVARGLDVWLMTIVLTLEWIRVYLSPFSDIFVSVLSAVLNGCGLESVEKGEFARLRGGSSDDAVEGDEESESKETDVVDIADGEKDSPTALSKEEDISSTNGIFDGKVPVMTGSTRSPPNRLYRYLLSYGRLGWILTMECVLFQEWVDAYLPAAGQLFRAVLAQAFPSFFDTREASDLPLSHTTGFVGADGTAVRGAKKKKAKTRKDDQMALNQLMRVGDVKAAKYKFLSDSFMRRHGIGRYASDNEEHATFEPRDEVLRSSSTSDDVDSDADWIVSALMQEEGDTDPTVDGSSSSILRRGPAITTTVNVKQQSRKKQAPVVDFARITSQTEMKRKIAGPRISDRESGVMGRIRAAGANSLVGRSLLGAYPGDAPAPGEAADPHGLFDLAEKYGYGDWTDDESDGDFDRKPRRRRSKASRLGGDRGSSYSPKSKRRTKKGSQSIGFGVEFGLTSQSTEKAASVSRRMQPKSTARKSLVAQAGLDAITSRTTSTRGKQSRSNAVRSLPDGVTTKKEQGVMDSRKSSVAAKSLEQIQEKLSQIQDKGEES